MERITSDELRNVNVMFRRAHADLGFDESWDRIRLTTIIERAAFTIDEMDKDIAVLESNRDYLREQVQGRTEF